MGALLSSPRWRRRLGFGCAAGLGVAVTAYSMVHWANTAHVESTPLRNEPAQVSSPPVMAPFATARREGVLATAQKFLRTAVVREHVADSWALTAPSLKRGFTPASWARAAIPVQPYPVDAARWEVDYSWVDVVGLKVALFPKHGTNVPPAVFDMELHAFGSGKNRRWLVDSWSPAGYQGLPQGPLGAPPVGPQVVVKQALPTRWLLLPIAVLALGLLVVTSVGVRGWWSGRRAVRNYKSTLG